MLAAVGLTLGLSVLAWVGVGSTVDWVVRLPLLAGLVVVTVLDFRTRLIPDLLTLPALAYALVIALVRHGARGLADATVAAIASGSVMLVAAILTRGGLGGGDIKLMAALGGALGWKAALATLALSQLLGGVIAFVLLLTRRGDRRSRFPVGGLIALLGALWLSLRS